MRGGVGLVVGGWRLEAATGVGALFGIVADERGADADEPNSGSSGCFATQRLPFERS